MDRKFKGGSFVAPLNYEMYKSSRINDCLFIIGYDKDIDCYEVWDLENFQGDIFKDLSERDGEAPMLIEISRSYIDEHYKIWTKQKII